ncbi:hypothetical protein A1F99_060300 [Pyrenophora tritici-repentis]|uniref:Uncharacterized protein n=1 Tax=Pyrenophora tritici-repentis TaxID=45151 RepID=A0A921TP08_9PLEO|nr:hypothetical protein A1F99_060300 [Pyrenophora tritici-repentis]KAI1514093.1 hypothetical protein Ptr86124_006723 [Pyrenophora tritici-repentis]KAI1666666.1 hypothetical protein L13192_08910 [Pyrenophora tritici-repentis]KAI1682499.1 hypothetical protein KJE20_07231 [Pyrenophora tritici-repentis]
MTMSGFNWPSRSTITMVAGDPGDSTSTSVLSTYQTSSDTTLMTVSYTDTVSSTPSVVISSGSSTVSSTSAVVISTDFTGVFNDTAFQGLPVTGQRHELEPPRYHKSDLVHELDGSSRPGELPSKDASSHTVECLKVADAGNIETTDDVAFDGEAQRRREVEWLEKEEARIRHKRETLLQQRVQRLV